MIYILSGFSTLLKVKATSFKFLIPHFRPGDGSNACYVQELSPDLEVVAMHVFAPEDYESLPYGGTDQVVEVGHLGILAFHKAGGEVFVAKADAALEALSAMDLLQGDGVAFALDGAFLIGDQARYEAVARWVDDKLGLREIDEGWLARELKCATKLVGRGGRPAPHHLDQAPASTNSEDSAPHDTADAMLEQLDEHLQELRSSGRHQKKRTIISAIAGLEIPSARLLQAATEIAEAHRGAPRVLEAVFELLPPQMSTEDGDKFAIEGLSYEAIQQTIFKIALARISGRRKLLLILEKLADRSLSSAAHDALTNDNDAEIDKARYVLASFGIEIHNNYDLAEHFSRYPFLTKRMLEGQSFTPDDVLNPLIALFVYPSANYRKDVITTRESIAEYLRNPALDAPSREERGLAGHVFSTVVRGRSERHLLHAAMDRVVAVDALFSPAFGEITVSMLQARGITTPFFDWYMRRCNIEAAVFITEIILTQPSRVARIFAQAVLAAREQFNKPGLPLDLNAPMRFVSSTFAEECSRIIARLRRISFGQH